MELVALVAADRNGLTSKLEDALARAYTEKRACNSLCTLRTHPTSYQRPDMLKIESNIRT